MKTVYTGGTFDIIHPGHVALLSSCFLAAGPSGQVVVALNTDEFVEQYKRRPPIMTYEERATVLSALSHVDKVVPNTGGWDSKPAIEAVRPDLIVVGYDWAGKDYLGQLGVTQAWLDQRGIGIQFVRHPWTHTISSTNIRGRVEARA